MKVIGHRGNSAVAPQNTLAAFEAAWRAGADRIEVDVQLTADRRVVVIHDDTVDATTDGTGAVGALTLDELRALDAGSWFSAAYAGQRVPTIDELAVFLAARPGLELLLEVKGLWDVDDIGLAVEPLLVAGVGPRLVAQSFEPKTVAALRDAFPDVPRGLLIEDRVPVDLDELADDLGVVTVNPDGALLVADPTLVPRLHAAGRAVATWTLNEPWMWSTALGLGVDAVITDRPDRLRGWLAAGGA